VLYENGIPCLMFLPPLIEGNSAHIVGECYRGRPKYPRPEVTPLSPPGFEAFFASFLGEEPAAESAD